MEWLSVLLSIIAAVIASLITLWFNRKKLAAETRSIDIDNSIQLTGHYKNEATEWRRIAEERKAEKQEALNLLGESKTELVKCNKQHEECNEKLEAFGRTIGTQADMFGKIREAFKENNFEAAKRYLEKNGE